MVKWIHKYRWIITGIVIIILIKVIWVAWSCWGNGSFENEKQDNLQRKNYLIMKVVVEPRQLLNEMPHDIGLQSQGEWTLYSCSMLTEVKATIL